MSGRSFSLDPLREPPPPAEVRKSGFPSPTSCPAASDPADCWIRFAVSNTSNVLHLFARQMTDGLANVQDETADRESSCRSRDPPALAITRARFQVESESENTSYFFLLSFCGLQCPSYPFCARCVRERTFFHRSRICVTNAKAKVENVLKLFQTLASTS